MQYRKAKKSQGCYSGHRPLDEPTEGMEAPEERRHHVEKDRGAWLGR
jgi:hypothetical protein